MGATLSFKDLFKKLAEYVLDPERRWDYCVRAKRGQMDTSIPGEYSYLRDYVYKIYAFRKCNQCDLLLK